MNVRDVADWVARIEAAKGDSEAAHGLEDDLHQAVIGWIAGGGSHGRAIAQEALKSLEIDFTRWYA